MIVCQCLDINERSIERVLDQLDDPDNATVAKVAETCGAGSDCTKCWPTIQELIVRRRKSQSVRTPA